MTTFYLATSFLNQDEGAKVRDALTDASHLCTFDWITFTECADETNGPEWLENLARQEVRAVRMANVFVLLIPGRLGAHTELGVALATGSKVYLLGDTEGTDCIFYSHRRVERVAGVPELLERLKEREPVEADQDQVMDEVKEIVGRVFKVPSPGDPDYEEFLGLNGGSKS